MKLKEPQCSCGKRTFTSEDDAKYAAREGMLLKNISLYVYFCLQCHNYHLTSQAPKRRK